MPATTSQLRFRAMGTAVSVLVDGRRSGAVAGVRTLFETWEATLSRFQPASELCRLNAAAGRPTEVGELLYTVADSALAAARATGGAFDPTLGTQLVAAGYAESFDIPSTARFRLTPPRPGGAWRHIVLDPAARTICLPSGAALDLGGIAKGMAVDAAVALLRAGGVVNALVNAGGDMRMIDGPDAWWPVGLTDVPEEFVTLRGGALATSSTSRRRWRLGGQNLHHLIDPRTGAPSASGVWSASVAAPTCAQAEVAAKTALILGPTAGARFLTDHGYAGILSRVRDTPVRVGAWPAGGAA